ERRVHPAQRGHFVCAIGGAGRKRSGREAQRAADCAMAAMQATSCVEALVERAEDHREHGAEGTMESADWIGERVGVLLDGCGNTRMCKLQQQGTARTQEYGGLPVYPPGDRSRTEYARERTGRRTPDKTRPALQSVRAHNSEPITLRCRCHILTAWAASFARSRLVSAASAAGSSARCSGMHALLSPAGDCPPAKNRSAASAILTAAAGGAQAPS